MRLTLRTLLAYLDGILEPNDAQEVGKKIEESEFATNLVHRIRDVMRRIRLGSPSPTEAGQAFDANTVAEYLDNTLDSDHVAEFERLCLDSDVHLAEVAASHQILTLVLGEPAEIDAEARQRMYELKDAPATASPPALPSSESSVTSVTTLDLDDEDFASGRRSRPRPTVPEYLREERKKRHWVAIAAAVALVVCFVGVVLLAFGQFESGTALGNVLVRMGVIAEPAEVAKAQEPPTEAMENPTAEQPSADATSQVASPPESAAKSPAAEPPAKAADEPAAAPPSPDSVAKSAPPPAVAPKEKTPAGDAAVKPAAKPIEPGAPETAAKTSGTPANVEPPAPANPLPPEPMARFMSNAQILLQDMPEISWQRVATDQVLAPTKLQVLPTYRAKVTLTVGVTLDIGGGSRIELLGSAPKELPGIRVLHGHVVLRPLAKAGSKLRVVFGDHTGVLTFTDADSVAALEVRRIHAFGTHPETAPVRVVATLYAASGGITWEESPNGPERTTRQLTPPQAIGFDGPAMAMPTASGELPAWIAVEPVKALERMASVSLAQALPTDKPALVGLLELAKSRPQKEVRWLALRSLGHIGQFSEMVGVLNDPARRLDWKDYVDELYDAVARDAESAAAIHMTLETQYPEQADRLYRMLWGYTDKDLEGGADAELVDALKDDSLPVRVLGVWNLKELTGLGGQVYQPEQTLAKRQASIHRWEQRLKAGEIRAKSSVEKTDAPPKKNGAAEKE